MVAKDSDVVTKGSADNTAVAYDYNVYFNKARNNTVYDATGNYNLPVTVIMGTHDLRTNPMLKSNYTLKSRSPAIDSGTAALAPATDLVGVQHPQGASYERGAFEYIP